MILKVAISATTFASLPKISSLARTSAGFFYAALVSRIGSGFGSGSVSFFRLVRTTLLLVTCGMALPVLATPDYLSYYALGRHTSAAVDHVNLYWVYGNWNPDEALAQLAEAKSFGLPALVHSEFVFFAGPYQSTLPRFALHPDAEARWAAFVTDLQQRGLLDSMLAVYPCDEPNLNGVSDGDLQAIINIIKRHPLSANKNVAALFSVDIAKEWGGLYALLGKEHRYRSSLRMLDWVGFDCYECSNIFTDPLWQTLTLQGLIDGPSAYANFRRQLDLPRQRIMLVPQSYLAKMPDLNGNFDAPDNPELFFQQAQNDPAVVALVPFTWFDQPEWQGTVHLPDTLAQYRSIGQRMAGANAQPEDARGAVVEYVSEPSPQQGPGEHYFYTDDVGEQQQLDTPASGFIRTGLSFKASPANTPGMVNMCRFYTAPANPGTHFFTPLFPECADLKNSRDWIFEGQVFAVTMPDFAGACPAEHRPLYRLYKYSVGGVPNHRLTSNAALRTAMLAYGWGAEGYGADGVISCVRY